MCRHVFARRARRRVTADAHPGLGPRSLSPRSLFEGAARELIRDQMSPRTTSATAFPTCGHSDRDSRDPRRDEGRNLLPFLTHPELPCGRGMRVEPRFVRRTKVRCWFLRLPGLPNRESSLGAPPSTAFTGEVSDDRRARAPGPSEGRVTVRVSSESCRSPGCVALVAHADNRSPPRRPRDTPCHRRAHSRRESPIPSIDEPAKTAAPPLPREGQRHPDDQGAFHRSECAGGHRDHSKCLPASVSRSRRPHVLHGLWRGALKGIASARSRGLPARSIREDERLCQPVG